MDKMRADDMRILKWICGKTRKDCVSNDFIEKMVRAIMGIKSDKVI